ncbi:MAG TPA: RelA/SpoT domain-containing protein [Nitrososphaera sp.]|nr:RelA/SpoT domain-containing protein [Nitrososphaera sp.]
MATYPPPDPAIVEECLARYRREHHTIEVFANSVHNFLATHPDLTKGDLPPVHSSKCRTKNEVNLGKKIVRKKVEDNLDITAANLLALVTDLGGVRILHLHREQFEQIHSVITQHVSERHWALYEPPTAYTWDPEYREFFAALGLIPQIKDSNYTSVHYVVKPNEESPITCEVQVRTLFEEVWGEIDHVLNYPVRIESIACSEQLRVLAKMVGAGSRLAEAIFRSHREFLKGKQEPK